MEEKKTYPITGTVTISTEEYRDLIEQKVAVLEEKISAEKEADKYRSKYWDYSNQTDELKKSIEKLEHKNEMIMKFIRQDSDRHVAYTKFVAENEED